MDKATFGLRVQQALVLADQVWFFARNGLQQYHIPYMLDEEGNEISQYLAERGERDVELVQKLVDGQLFHVAQVAHWDYRSDEPTSYIGQGTGATAEEAFQALFERLRTEASRIEIASYVIRFGVTSQVQTSGS